MVCSVYSLACFLGIILLIGAAEYPLTPEEASRLERTLRRRCLKGPLPHTDHARACLQFADVLAEDLEAGASPEPIELGVTHVEGLHEYLIEDADVALADLRAAVRRYCEG
jgi:hypothetical protein